MHSLLANPILNTDSYKASHFLQYPPMVSGLMSYIEGRGDGRKKTTFFGLQMYMLEYLTTPITQEDIDVAELIFTAHGEPFNRRGWEYILEKHNGFMPIRIKAVPEGLRIPTGNVLVTVESTDPNCIWIVNYVETSMLRAVWYPTSVCSVSRDIKGLIYDFLVKTSEDPDGQIPFKLHDFGSRGVSSKESAAIGGCAHLVNFQGTDTIEGILAARVFYNCDMAGYSIPAAEHSTITSWGRAHEVDAYRNMIKQFGGKGKLVAIVSDSYDIYNACTNIYGKELKQEIIDDGATVVIRPDSGHPPTVVLKCLELLGAEFGYTINAKGFKVLNNVKVLQGDGIEFNSILDILTTIRKGGWSTDNVAFGMGGALLQHPNRDTYSFAMKCCAIRKDGVWQDVYKEPKTDSGKNSKRGRISLFQRKSGEYYSEKIEVVENNGGTDVEVLVPVFQDGKILKLYTFDEVRANSLC
ncbi:MAG: nicotinate phosphoribosyltransferase [Candidatus Cloacimonetes bacterium]|nr:nicotinate phosphoribosyltransferase [Candidatus Cloacimonadota bacterium]